VVAGRLVSFELERFVARHFGARGRAWLDQLPERVEHHRREWQLVIEDLLPGGLESCCLAVRTKTGEAAVLKLTGPWTPVGQEVLALTAWRGRPAPQLLRTDEERGALLLERIRPGDRFDGELREWIDRLALLMNALHAVPVSAAIRRQLPSLASVAEAHVQTAGDESAARSTAEAIEMRPRLERARARTAALMSSRPDRLSLLHGDLENKNILRCQKRGLVAIDPSPCIGEPAYDAGYWLAAAVDQGRRDELSTELSTALGLDPARVRAWAAVVALEP
jgi:streptomycin 6-kinase